MHVIVTLSDLIALYVLGGLLVICALICVVTLIGYEFSRLIKWIQERFWKK